MVTLKQISHSFEDDAGQVNQLFNNLDITFEAGSFTNIIGANGSGKSTLLNIIAGLTIPNQGKVFINQNEVQHLNVDQRSKYVARIFQNPLQGSVAELTVIENMRLASLRNTHKGLKLGINNQFIAMVKQRIAQLDLGLENKIAQKMGTLSGGQRQALTLVMATLCDADVLLMDEPTSALDPKSALSLMDNAAKIIQEKKHTAIMVTHNMREAVNYGNRLLMMKAGKVEKDIAAQEKSTLTHAKLFDWLNEV